MIAFPEGVRGMNKLIWERYQLQEFGHGFMRLALETRHARSCPIAVVGSEEQAPGDRQPARRSAGCSACRPSR